MSHFFLSNAPASTTIHTLSLHDALPICRDEPGVAATSASRPETSSPRILSTRSRLALLCRPWLQYGQARSRRSEEHTSELQSPMYLVCRLLLEKKKTLCHQQHTREDYTA